VDFAVPAAYRDKFRKQSQSVLSIYLARAGAVWKVKPELTGLDCPTTVAFEIYRSPGRSFHDVRTPFMGVQMC